MDTQRVVPGRFILTGIRVGRGGGGAKRSAKYDLHSDSAKEVVSFSAFSTRLAWMIIGHVPFYDGAKCQPTMQ